MAKDTKNPRMSEIRKVVSYYVGGGRDVHFVLESELELMLDAIQKLHFSPGINPHNGQKTAMIFAIEVEAYVPDISHPYWWSCPSLNEDKNGATVLQFVSVKRLEFNYTPSEVTEGPTTTG